MNNVIFLKLIAACVLIFATGCAPVDEVRSQPNSVSGSNEGLIAFIRETSPGLKELYLQEIEGVTPTGPAFNITDRDYVSSQEVRYPKFVPDHEDRAFVYYVAKKNRFLYGDFFDEIILSAKGKVIARHHNTNFLGTPCKDLAYPQMIWYNGTNDNLPLNQRTVTYRLDAFCGDTGTMLSWEVVDLLVNAPQPQSFMPVVTPKQYESRPVEIATYPKGIGISFINDMHGFSVAVSNNGNLSWDNTRAAQVNGPTICDINDIESVQGNHTGNFYVAANQAAEAGHGNIIPFPTPITKAYAPSVTMDRKYLIFNSEAFANDPNRGEELFLIDTKFPECYNYALIPQQNSPGGIGPRFVSTITQLTNEPGNEYGSFAVNAHSNLGKYPYAMWRHEDPQNNQNSTLYVTSDIGTQPVRLHPNETRNEFEAAWIYGE